MDPFEGAVLGIVQGLTEPLPISSSAHLVLVPWLLGWPEHSLTFDVALHMGTLAALLIFFCGPAAPGAGLAPGWAPPWEWCRGPPPPDPPPRRTIRCACRQQRRLGLGLVVGDTAALLGALFVDQIESSLRSRSRSPPCSSSGRCCWGSPTASAPGAWSSRTWGWTQALLVGLAQALALAPGVSRSGITLTAALFIGLTREAGARYAFLLGIPVTAGAGGVPAAPGCCGTASQSTSGRPSPWASSAPWWWGCWRSASCCATYASIALTCSSTTVSPSASSCSSWRPCGAPAG